MDKISGILPPSARTRFADVSASQPARPGAPSMGRPDGRNSLGDRLTLSKEIESIRQGGEFFEPMPPPMSAPTTYTNTAEGKKAKVIEELNNRFFAKVDLHKQPGEAAKSEEMATSTQQNAPSLFLVEPELRASLKPVQE